MSGADASSLTETKTIHAVVLFAPVVHSAE